jgi:hypothetical protein
MAAHWGEPARVFKQTAYERRGLATSVVGGGLVSEGREVAFQEARLSR